MRMAEKAGSARVCSGDTQRWSASGGQHSGEAGLISALKASVYSQRSAFQRGKLWAPVGVQRPHPDHSGESGGFRLPPSLPPASPFTLPLSSC